MVGDFREDLDTLKRIQEALRVNYDGRLAPYYETVETLIHYATALIKFNEYYEKLGEHLRKPRGTSIDVLKAWTIQWMVLFASSDDWMTHVR